MQKAKSDADQKSTQIEKLQADESNLKRENDRLGGQIISLTGENATLKATVTGYSNLPKELENSKKEITALNSQLWTLTEERDKLLRDNQSLRAQVPARGGGGGQGGVEGSGPVVVFQTLRPLFQNKTVALSGDEFKGSLTLKFGEAMRDKQPVYILETEGGRIVKTENFKPSRTSFVMPFSYNGKSYQLEGRVAGEMSPALRDIKVVRLAQ